MLTRQYSYLMHALLAMSILHKQYLYSKRQPIPQRVIYHWQQCLTQYNKNIAPSITNSHADAMLITSTLINGISFVMLDQQTLEETWPLASSANSLQWLSLAPGISLVFRATFPLDSTSKVKDLFADVDDYSEGKSPSLPTPQDLLFQLPQLSKVCGVTSTSDILNNPYVSRL